MIDALQKLSIIEQNILEHSSAVEIVGIVNGGPAPVDASGWLLWGSEAAIQCRLPIDAVIGPGET